MEGKAMTRGTLLAALALTGALAAGPAAMAAQSNPMLGLPPVPVPADNPQTPEKVALGDKLFNDKRFSSTGARLRDLPTGQGLRIR
jgi:cytochrome c peroxidase